MSKSVWFQFAFAMLALAALASAGWAQQQGAAQGPSIVHEPPRFAVKGQPLSILAKVQAGNSPIKAVSLHYSPSRDTAPIKQPMTSAGPNVYVATVPSTHMSSMPSVWYYIEAVDQQDEWAETEWHQVQVGGQREPDPTPAAAKQSPAGPGVPTVTPSQEKHGASTGKLIAGGVLAAGAAVAIIAASGGGGSSDGGGGGTDGSSNDTSKCADSDAAGIWVGADTSLAPGFILQSSGSARFFASVDGEPDVGSWGLVGCDLTLVPMGTNSVYRGTGTLSDDKMSVTINGFMYQKN